MNYQHALQWAQTKLSHSESPHLDSEVLLSFITKKPRSVLLSHWKDRLGFLEQMRFVYAVYKRKKHIPIAYITKEKSFYGFDFFVNKYVLIPRPDTESIIEYLQKAVQEKNPTFVDLGTGSGCIAITLKKLFPDSHCIATDISPRALAAAKYNAKKFATTITFLQGSLWEPLRAQKITKPLIVIANLPYLPKHIQNSSIAAEPKQALYAEENGLALYKQLLMQITTTPIKPDMLCLETLPEQMDDLEHIAHSLTPLYTTSRIKDLGGSERYVILKVS